MNTTATQEQSERALKILKHVSRDGFKAYLVSPEERNKLGNKKNEERAWYCMPAFVVDDRYWCGWDVWYGHDIVIDLTGQTAHTSTRGIFTDEFVFISDYHGQPTGAFYYRAL